MMKSIGRLKSNSTDWTSTAKLSSKIALSEEKQTSTCSKAKITTYLTNYDLHPYFHQQVLPHDYLPLPQLAIWQCSWHFNHLSLHLDFSLTVPKSNETLSEGYPIAPTTAPTFYGYQPEFFRSRQFFFISSTCLYVFLMFE